MYYRTLHDVALYFTVYQLVTLRYVMLRYVMLRYFTLHYVALRYVRLRHVTLCYVMLCYVTLRYNKSSRIGEVTKGRIQDDQQIRPSRSE